MREQSIHIKLLNNFALSTLFEYNEFLTALRKQNQKTEDIKEQLSKDND
jgi:hypothetical protein